MITDNAPGSPHTVELSGTGQDFAVGMKAGSSDSATIRAGGAASYSLSIVPGGGLSGTVSFTCAGAPAKAACAVNPASVMLNGSAVTATVTVTTAGPTMVAPRGVPPAGSGHPLRWLIGLAGIWLLVLAAMLTRMPQRNHSWIYRARATALLTAVSLLLLGGISCGGTAIVHTPGTPVGSYTLMVTASHASGSTTLTHSVPLKLVVN